MGYAPLDFFNNDTALLPEGMTCRTGHMWEDFYPAMLQGFLGLTKEETESLTQDEYLTYVLRRKFMTKGNKSDRYAKWDSRLMEVVPSILSELGYAPSAIRDPETVRSEVRDTMVEYLILDKWVRNKQVLKPDPVFAKYLCGTEKLQVTENIFSNLPFNTFYLDLEEANKEGSYGDVLGIFVNIHPMPVERETAVTLYVLRPGNIVVSMYLSFHMEPGPQEISTAGIEDSRQISTVPVVIRDQNAPENTQVNPRLMTVLVLQLISYMKAAKPDILPAPEMKSTYKPRETIKNKYSEIYKQEVGIRVGKTISDKIRKMNEAKEEQEREAVSKGHKPPTPHFRCAHWHRYWTGKGRTVCELRWIEPVFVCGSYSSDSATDVVIHGVTGSTE